MLEHKQIDCIHSLKVWNIFTLDSALMKPPLMLLHCLDLVMDCISGLGRLPVGVRCAQLNLRTTSVRADLPIDCTLPTLFVTILYWMGGLTFSARAYFETLFSVLLLVLVAQSFGLLIGAIVPIPKTAQV